MFRLLFLIITYIFLTGCAVPKTIAVTDVNEFVVLVDQAFMRQDIDSVDSYLSDSLKVAILVGGKLYEYDKNGYLELLKNSWEKVDSYVYRKLTSTIDMVDESKAIISEVVFEEMTIGNEMYSFQSNIIVDVRRINGRLVAVRLDAESVIRK